MKRPIVQPGPEGPQRVQRKPQKVLRGPLVEQRKEPKGPLVEPPVEIDSERHGL